jgi:hypothetical protein
MAFLGFPLAWLAGRLFVFLLYSVGLEMSTSYGELAMTWLIYAGAGYYQWFYFMPPAFSRKARRSRDRR